MHVEPATVAQLECLLAGADVFRDRFGLTVADGYVLEFPDAELRDA